MNTELHKQWLNLTLADNFLFQKYMQNVENCKKLIDPALHLATNALLAKYKPQSQKLNLRAELDYDKSIKLKIKFLKELYKLCGKQVMESKAFITFLIEYYCII